MKVLKIILAIVCGLFIFFLATCVGCAGLIGAGIEESEKQDSIKKEKIASGEISWEYSTEKDEMGRGETQYASLPSIDDQFILTLRNSPKFGKDIYISNNDDLGEWFATDIDGEGTLKAKFDDGEIKSYSFSGPESSVDDMAFISDYDDFLKKLKSAKKLIIEAKFVNRGDMTITFNVENLKWED